MELHAAGPPGGPDRGGVRLSGGASRGRRSRPRGAGMAQTAGRNPPARRGRNRSADEHPGFRRRPRRSSSARAHSRDPAQGAARAGARPGGLLACGATAGTGRLAVGIGAVVFSGPRRRVTHRRSRRAIRD